MRAFDVSVVIPVYRGRQTIGRAITSIDRQAVRPLEVLIVDNEPDPELAMYIPPARCRIELLCEPRRGAAAARNVGLAAAKGRWTAFLDCDDEWHPGFLASMFTASSNRDAVLYAGGALVYSGSTAKRVSAPQFGSNPWRHLLLGNDVTTSSAMVSTRAALQCGGFFEGARASGEDWALWLNLAKSGAVTTVPSAVAVRHEDPMSGRRRNHAEMDSDLVAVLAQALGPHPTPRELAIARAGTLARRGTWLLSSGERGEARRLFRAALLRVPCAPSLWMWAALAHVPAGVEQRVRKIRLTRQRL
jgi:glycosyltransferase involved in cell wall biosynthesis